MSVGERGAPLAGVRGEPFTVAGAPLGVEADPPGVLARDDPIGLTAPSRLPGVRACLPGVTALPLIVRAC